MAEHEPLPEGDLRFVVHAPDHGEVSALVFAGKLDSLVRALQAADQALNGGRKVHEYTIYRLHNSSPTAILREQTVEPQLTPVYSGITGFQECVDAATLGRRDDALRYGKCIEYVKRLAARPKHGSYAYAEVWPTSEEVIRIDAFLQERAIEVIEEPRPAELAAEPEWYSGAAIGSFDGELKAVDLTGALPMTKLILSAGNKVLDCVCRNDQIEDIRQNLNRRVRITGRAIYDGRSGLPRRVEVTSIAGVPEAQNFERWKGSFHHFEVPDWNGDLS